MDPSDQSGPDISQKLVDACLTLNARNWPATSARRHLKPSAQGMFSRLYQPFPNSSARVEGLLWVAKHSSKQQSTGPGPSARLRLAEANSDRPLSGRRFHHAANLGRWPSGNRLGRGQWRRSGRRLPAGSQYSSSRRDSLTSGFLCARFDRT